MIARIRMLLLLVAALTAGGALAQGPGDYVPPRHDWESRSPAELGFDAGKLTQAVAFAQARAVIEPADMRQVLLDNYTGREPNYRILGPTRDRVGSAGIILRHGYKVAEWGDVQRPDMTFSAVKSYLATVAGLLWADGRIADFDHRVAGYIEPGLFASEHNAPITWRHLLQQTSDWQGTLWEIPDWADRPEGETETDWPNRPLSTPGSRFKYNDVRINLLALSLLHVARQPLPELLRERIMDPIGASPTWRWHGYENSWLTLDGQKIQSVSGGGHFGGGMFVGAEDHARFGLLMLRRGVWGERRLLPDAWFDLIRAPTEAKPDYGFLWWLNTGRQAIPEAPESAYWAAGFGGHYIYIDEVHDLVIVLRWVPELRGTVAAVLAALNR